MQQAQRDAKMAHEALKKDMDDNHRRQMTMMKRDNDRKVKNDREKFESLLEQKEKMLEDFQKSID